MAVWSVVRVSELEGPTRLDAEYYQPNYTDAVSAVNAFGSTKRLAEIGRVLRGRNPTKYTESGIPIIRAIDLRDITDLSNVLYASPNEPLFYLNEQDVLISSIGAGSIGKVELFADFDGKAATVSEVSVVRVTKGRFNPETLAIFLRSRYGYLQLERRITGSTGQLHLYPKDIGTVLVPLFDEGIQKQVTSVLRESAGLSRQSRLFYRQAEQTLLEEIGWDELDLTQPKWWTAPLSRAREVRRLDAEYFRPRHELAMRLLMRSNQRLKDVVKLAKRRFKPLAGRPFKYIEIGNLTANGFANTETLMGEDAPSRASWIARANDVITSTVRPIRRLSAIIEPDQAGSICSSGFAVLEATGIEPEVLLVYLRLPFVCEILDLFTTASMYPAVSTADLLNIPIPLLERKASQVIADQVVAARGAYRTAKALLEEAKLTVEEAIAEAAQAP